MNRARVEQANTDAAQQSARMSLLREALPDDRAHPQSPAGTRYLTDRDPPPPSVSASSRGPRATLSSGGAYGHGPRSRSPCAVSGHGPPLRSRSPVYTY